MDINSTMILLSGIAWTITYIALVYRGFKDKSYGMPLVALALNFTWELTFSIIYPPQSGGTIATIINTIWFICDIAIVISYFKFGYKYVKESLNVNKKTFLLISILAFLICFLIMYIGGPFFAQFNNYFNNDLFESAKFIAYIQNAVMSVLFVNMFYTRKKNNHPIEGQSFYIALMKMIGTAFTVGISYILLHPTSWYFMGVFIFTSLIFDLWYSVLIFRELRKHGINPLLRL